MAYTTGSGGVSARDAINYAKKKKRSPTRRKKKRICPHGVGPTGKCLPLMGD
jgi:hypothetical protein